MARDLKFTRNRLMRWLSGLEEIPRSSKTMEARKNIFAKILSGETAAALENKKNITPDDMNKVKALIYKTEKEVMNEITNEFNNMTMIIIAHRLNTVRMCDCIFLLNDGKVMNSGTYDELIKSSSEFKRMVEV